MTQEKQTWFRAIVWSNKIEEHTVVKETAQFVTYEYDGWNDKKVRRREAKRSQHEAWFKTKQEAVDFLRNRLLDKIAAARHLVTSLEKELIEFDKEYSNG